MLSRRTLEAVLLAIAFAVAHTQSPLYYSNQNQYLLHGAALAHHGHCANDWLATTRDPTPVFSAFVAATYATLGPWLLQPAFFVLLMAYYLAARRVVAAVPGFPDTPAARLAFAALFTAAHAGIVRWLSVQAVGVDYPWYLQAGVAAQYLLGPGIQPSAFGVLLLIALACFAHGRAYWAAALAALAVVVHATYAIPSALLTAGFMLSLARRGDGRKALRVGMLALAIVTPVVIYGASQFTENESYRLGAAQRILAFERIPHHCVPARWFDAVAGLQVVWCVLGIVLLRRTPLFVPLSVAAAGGAALTAVQLATDSPALALLFPWRITTLLVPLATAAVAARLVSFLLPSPLAGEGGRPAQRGDRVRGETSADHGAVSRTETPPTFTPHPVGTHQAFRPPSPARGEGKKKTGALAVLAALVVGGVCVPALGLGYRTVDEDAIYDHVRRTAKPDSVYLLPAAWPKVSSGRGAVSNTFAPPPRAAAGTNQIPVDLQRFRLATGARAYVDFKSVPYAPAEVLEWQRRMNFAVKFNSSPGRNLASDEVALRMEGITHVVAPASKPFEAYYLKVEYADDAYIVYRVE